VSDRVRWDRIAVDYYDELAHPRTAALRRASEALLAGWIKGNLRQLRRVLEVGAGRGVDLSEVSGSAAVVVGLDHSMAMLHASSPRSWTSAVHADAGAMPFLGGSFDLIVASLGAPFNALPFWLEARRLVVPAGCVLLTGPGWAWAEQDRAGTATGIASFDAAGSLVEVPSLVWPQADQERLVAEAGLRIVAQDSASATVGGARAVVELYVATI